MEQYNLFSSSQVSLHSSKNDCWLIIHGKVYDVTKFLEEHPGGEDVLIDAAGKGDATDAFEEVGHSSTATSMMSSYMIGVLEGSDPGHVGGTPQSLKKSARDEGSSGKAEEALKMKKPSSTSAGFLDFLMPLLVIGLAFAAWYSYHNKGYKA